MKALELNEVRTAVKITISEVFFPLELCCQFFLPRQVKKILKSKGNSRSFRLILTYFKREIINFLSPEEAIPDN
jgi:hypothetical protein